MRGCGIIRRMRLTLQSPDLNLLLSPARVEMVADIAAQGLEEAIKQWYQRLPETWFDSRRKNFPDGTPRHGGPRRFMQALTRAWTAERPGKGQVELQFRQEREDGTPWGLRLQEYGGEIRPRNVWALTIPLTAEARGRRAAEFSQTVHKLFAVNVKKANGDKAGTLVWKDENGSLHAAYALRKRAVIKPLKQRRGHHGVPTKNQLVTLSKPYFRDAVLWALQQG